MEEDISSLITINDNLKCIKANESEVEYRTKSSEKKTRNKLDKFNDGSGFIVGYMVWN